jgi:hypothetical protein
MKFVVGKKKPQSYRLQSQEHNYGKKSADEKEYITHLV